MYEQKTNENCGFIVHIFETQNYFVEENFWDT